MKLSAADLLLLNVDKLFAVPSLIGLSNFPFKHVSFTHIHNSVRAKLLSDAKSCIELFFHTMALQAGMVVILRTTSNTEFENMSHNLTSNTVYMQNSCSHGQRTISNLETSNFYSRHMQNYF